VTFDDLCLVYCAVALPTLLVVLVVAVLGMLGVWA
jgi:hypothetical protein